MCVEAFNGYLAALKLIPNLFVTSKMLEKLYTTLYADENILLFLNNNFDKDDLILLFLSEFWLDILN